MSDGRAAADVIVIGAGAAGLAAADALRAAGTRVVVLEARTRPGGRILTHRVQGSATPIELGAEFLHGDADETCALLARGRLRSLDVTGRRWLRTSAGLRPLDDFWRRVRGVMRYLPDERTRDVTFQHFLDGRPGGRGAAADRRLTRCSSRASRAADAHRVSSVALGGGSDPSGDADDQILGRVLDGYDQVIGVLAGPLGTSIRYHAVVETVRWQPGRVEVIARVERAAFGTWWTAVPERTPRLVAWQGGPGALELPRDPEALRDTVVGAMADAFGLAPRRARAQVAALHWHDWQADPYARGAYSHQVLGGVDAPASLGRPVRGTVFVAGEATASDGRIGTVDGALASGYRAAREVQRALRRRRVTTRG